MLERDAALATLGRRKDDVRAIVLTHAHFDHIGFAERARHELHVPVWCHENDVPLTRRPMQYGHERPRSLYLLRPKALPPIAAFAKARAFFPRPIAHVERCSDGTLPVPGSPHVVFTPGHTLGHCSLHFPERDALIAGDAVVTFNRTSASTGRRSSPGRRPPTPSERSARSTRWPRPARRPSSAGTARCGATAPRRSRTRPAGAARHSAASSTCTASRSRTGV